MIYLKDNKEVNKNETNKVFLNIKEEKEPTNKKQIEDKETVTKEIKELKIKNEKIIKENKIKSSTVTNKQPLVLPQTGATDETLSDKIFSFFKK